MVYINYSNMFGKGHHRECYKHPENNNLCIKISIDSNLSKRQSQREKKYYKYLENKDISWDMVPRYHGDIITNKGIGSVFDLVLDHSGDISKTLSHYISSNKITKENYSSLKKSLSLLKNYLLEQKIITSMGHRNIVCQRNESEIYRLLVIDNIGNTDFIPICNYSAFLAKRKIQRRWKRFENDMLTDFQHNKALYQILTN